MNQNEFDDSTRRNTSTINPKIIGLFLLIIGLIALVIRLYYTPFGIPLTQDALYYFAYSSDINFHQGLPMDWSPSNNGWPVFVSLVFPLFQSNNFIDYMNIQRLLSIIISVLTLIPIYFLCKKFIDAKFALIGPALFVFDPRIILNSILGITDVLYIFLGAIALTLFLDTRYKLVYLAFGITALATLVRSEAQFLFIALSIMFFIKFRKESNLIPRYLFVASIFFIIIIPMSLYRVDVIGSDGIFLRVSQDTEYIFSQVSDSQESNFLILLKNTFEIFFKYLGWVMIPTFVFFVPVGVFLFLRCRNFEKNTIIITTILMSLPALGAYAYQALDTRYLYFLFPMFCIFSVYSTQKFVTKFKKQNIILILIFIGIISTSIFFYEIKKIDYEYEKEVYEVAKLVIKSGFVVNDYYPESKYLQPAQIPEQWPLLFSLKPYSIKPISTENFYDIENFITKSKNDRITHIIIDENQNRPKFLKDIFYNEQTYPFLEKIYDSKDKNLKYHVKIFKINFDKFT